jgi:hypothetical protein
MVLPKNKVDGTKGLFREHNKPKTSPRTKSVFEKDRQTLLADLWF